MLMQYLPPEERKGPNRYKQGDFILYRRMTTNDADQKRLKKELQENPKLAEYGIIAKGICSYCGGTFYQWKRTGSGRTTKYCCARCENDAYMARRKARHDQLLIKTCTTCGQEFTAKKVDALYCSNSCKQKAYRLRKNFHNGNQ